MSITRNQQPHAVITRMKGGEFVVQLPGGRGVLADTLVDAKRFAYWGGAIVIEFRNIPVAEQIAAQRILKGASS